MCADFPAIRHMSKGEKNNTNSYSSIKSFYLPTMKLFRVIAFVLSITIFFVSCKKDIENITPILPEIVGDNDPINLGNPTNAQTSISFPENYLKNNNYYKLAYSKSRGIPVWVAWHLTE